MLGGELYYEKNTFEAYQDRHLVHRQVNAAIRAWAEGKTNVRLIVNRVNEKMFSAMRLTVDDIMDEAGIPLLGLVPEDDNVVLAAAFKKPLLKQTKRGAAAACRRIAGRLQGMSIPVAL